jgi:hypothetical protein
VQELQSLHESERSGHEISSNSAEMTGDMFTPDRHSKFNKFTDIHKELNTEFRTANAQR